MTIKMPRTPMLNIVWVLYLLLTSHMIFGWIIIIYPQRFPSYMKVLFSLYIFVRQESCLSSSVVTLSTGDLTSMAMNSSPGKPYSPWPSTFMEKVEAIRIEI